MSYIEQSLGDGETVIRQARFHWLYTGWAWACMVLPLALLVSILAGSRTVPLNWANPLTYVLALGFVALLAGVVTSVQMLVLKWTTEIAITSHRFVEKRGLFTLRTGEIALPVAGLMSLEPYEAVRDTLHHLRQAAFALGATLEEPFLQLAFLPLPVIPHLKISDRGMVDVDRFALIG